MFMAGDTSPDFEDTQAFLDRRFEDVRTLGSTIGQVNQLEKQKYM
jgi:ubiquinone biosynthesis protein COQ9